MFCLRWIISKSHKDIGIILIVFGAFNGILGTLLSILIRIEWSPGNVIFNSYFQMFNVVVTAHAFIMIFFMVMPILIGGYGNWFLPIKIGTPSITFFPRLNNLSFWLLPIFFILILVLCFIGWYYLGGVQVQSELDVIAAANTTVNNGSNESIYNGYNASIYNRYGSMSNVNNGLEFDKDKFIYSYMLDEEPINYYNLIGDWDSVDSISGVESIDVDLNWDNTILDLDTYFDPSGYLYLDPNQEFHLFGDHLINVKYLDRNQEFHIFGDDRRTKF